MFSFGISQAQVEWRQKITKIVPVGLLLVIGSLFFSACAPTTTAVKSPASKPFRSNDYIVYQLQDNETSAELAQTFLGESNKSWRVEEANPGVRYSRGREIVIPLQERNRGGLSADGFQTIPILTYHRFAESCDSNMCMPRKAFEDQMRYLSDNGYHVITAQELMAFLEYRQGLPKKSVLITMDDGYRSVYNIAYPILKEFGYTATLFIYTDFVGVSKMAVTWDQLKEMKADGFMIGSHTIAHSDLTRPQEDESEPEYFARIKKELNGSKKILDQKLAQNTFVLAYPFGYYDQQSMQMAKKAGYKVAMSVKRGGNPFFANPLVLRRDQILERDMDTFRSRLKTFNHLSLK
jgi:peptidoglycan/xylan/chitin deacetylase (PgdA/CDA1 family)